MTDSQTTQVEEIQALLAERKKYEQWITQLEERKESTPSHVYVKVRGDYVVRLTEAQSKLSSGTGVVEKLAAELESSLATHEILVKEKQDERSEAELRASVGEYSDKEWDKLRVKLDGAIGDLSGQRDGLQRELDGLRKLLAEARAPVSPALRAAPPAAEAAPPLASPVAKASDVRAPRSSAAVARPAEPSVEPAAPEASAPAASAPAAAAPAAAPEVKKADVDELAFLRSVLGRSTPYTGAGGVPAVTELPPELPGESAQRKSGAVPRPSGAQAARPSVDAPAPRPSVAAPVARPSGAVPAPRSSGAVPSRPSSATRASASFSLPEAPEPLSEPAAETTERRDPPRASGMFAAHTPRTSEALRSLKCQECGTLNFPTEWYCERCGGELAAF